MNATLEVAFTVMPKRPQDTRHFFWRTELDHYGGAYLVHRFLTQIGFKDAVASEMLAQRNHRYSVGPMLLALLYPMILRLEWIETTQLLRQDGVFQYLTGLPSYPNATTQVLISSVSIKGFSPTFLLHVLLSPTRTHLSTAAAGIGSHARRLAELAQGSAGRQPARGKALGVRLSEMLGLRIRIDPIEDLQMECLKPLNGTGKLFEVSG